MMIDKIVGNILTLIGTAFVGLALFLCLQNIHEEKIALQGSESALFFITTAISESEITTDIDTKEELVPLDIDGNLYVGMLDIPDLQLQLPIQSEWSYPKLKISPCIYQNEPFSIIAHNYNAHFANIGTLTQGAEVSYITVNGARTIYRVVGVEKIHQTEVEKLNDSSYDLTLVTCNYSNNDQRVIVRLKEITN